MATLTVHILSRPRVSWILADAVAAHPLTVLAAPAGYGKTTAARELAAMPGMSAVLVGVPAGQQNAYSFWDTALEQMENQGLAIAAILRRHGFPVDDAQTRRVIDICRADREPLLLIIDDYQNASDPAIDDFLTTLIRASLPGFRILLLSRVVPGSLLDATIPPGSVARFDHRLLAFSQEEAVDYFRLHGNASAKAAKRAWEYCEGWPAALWLCLQNLRLPDRLTSPSDITRLLSDTVFDSYDAENRDFLMRFSVMEHATAEEAAVFAEYPDAHRRLDDLEKRNAFITKDAAGNYQLHSLFRSFLADRLAVGGIDRAALYGKAGECLVRRGDLMAALRFFVRAGREEDQLRILDLFSLKNGNLLLFLHPGEVQAAVLAIPWRVRCRRPLQYLTFLYYCLVEANDLRAAGWLAEANDMFIRSEDITPAVKERLAGEATLIRAILSFNNLHAMREDYVRAHSMLGGRSAIAHRDMVWTFGCPHNAYLWLRDASGYTALVELMEQDLHYFHELTGGCGTGGDSLLLGEYHLERCEFDLVSRLLAAAARRAMSKEQLTTMLATAFSRARLLAATGRGREAAKLLKGWEGKIRDIGHVDLANCLDLSLGYLHAVLGNHGGIPEWLRSGDIGLSQTVPQMAGFIQVVHAKALLLAGDYARLDAVAADIPSHIGSYNNLFGRIHAKALAAAAWHHLRGLDAALAPAAEAVELARPDGILLTLAEYGTHILPMLRRLWKPHRRDSFFAALLRQTERQAGEPAGDGKAAARDKRKLTPREREMMRLVVKGKSNQDIAKKLGIMPDTVKKTLASAYGKLKAKNRAEAVGVFL